MDSFITALPKGRLLKPVAKILQVAGLMESGLDIDEISRDLVVKENDGRNSYLLAKPRDVPAYVEHGAADIGITGKDVIKEHGRRIYELSDLGIGGCKLVVAVPEKTGIETPEQIPDHSRVATSYPRITEEFFRELGVQIDVIYLSGSVELAPRVGLSDFIVDITSTGTTLRKNNLSPIADIMQSTARLIVNNVSYKTGFNRIMEIVGRIEEVVAEDDRD